MHYVDQWMLENIHCYSEQERKEFLVDCRKATGAAERTIRHHYRELFKPTRNNVPGNWLENNNPRFDTGPSGVVPREQPVTVDVRELKERQKEQDLARVARTEFRSTIRAENVLEEYIKNLVGLFQSNPLGSALNVSGGRPTKQARVVLVNQLGDIHGNEEIDIPGNKYNFEILGKRLKKLAIRTISLATAEGAEHILVALTGDNLNHDSLNLDKRLGNSENRAKATFKMVDLFKQYIEEISRDFPVTVASVCGNEGRVHAETGYSDFVVSDNYDYTIFNILKLVFNKPAGNRKLVDFIEGDPKELVVNVCGHNILLTHGEVIKDQCEANVSKIMGRYAAKGIILRYIIFGHLHSARIGDFYGRTSSMCGPNGYSERGLNLTSRASQNLFIVRDSGDVDGVKVDLQCTDGISGYVTMRDTSGDTSIRGKSVVQLVG